MSEAKIAQTTSDNSQLAHVAQKTTIDHLPFNLPDDILLYMLDFAGPGLFLNFINVNKYFSEHIYNFSPLLCEWMKKNMGGEDGLWHYLLTLNYPSDTEVEDENLTAQCLKQYLSQKDPFADVFCLAEFYDFKTGLRTDGTTNFRYKLHRLLGYKKTENILPHFPDVKPDHIQLKLARKLQQVSNSDQKSAEYHKDLLKFLRQSYQVEKLLRDTLFIKEFNIFKLQNINTQNILMFKVNMMVELLSDPKHQKLCSWRIWVIILSIPSPYLHFFLHHKNFHELMLKYKQHISELLNISPAIQDILLQEINDFNFDASISNVENFNFDDDSPNFGPYSFVFDILIKGGLEKELLTSPHGQTIKEILNHRDFLQNPPINTTTPTQLLSEMLIKCGLTEDFAKTPYGQQVEKIFSRHDFLQNPLNTTHYEEKNEYIHITNLERRLLHLLIPQEAKESENTADINTLLKHIFAWPGRFGLSSFAKALTGNYLTFEQIKKLPLPAKITGYLSDIDFYPNLEEKQWAGLCETTVREVIKYRDTFKQFKANTHLKQLRKVKQEVEKLAPILVDLLVLRMWFLREPNDSASNNETIAILRKPEVLIRLGFDHNSNEVQQGTIKGLGEVNSTKDLLKLFFRTAMYENREKFPLAQFFCEYLEPQLTTVAENKDIDNKKNQEENTQPNLDDINKPKCSRKSYTWPLIFVAAGLILGAAAILSGIGIISIPILATYLLASFGSAAFLGGGIGTAFTYCKNRKYSRLPQTPTPIDLSTSSTSETSTTSASYPCGPGCNPASFLAHKNHNGNDESKGHTQAIIFRK